ncbi:hypothetical protein [Myroides sp. DW712]|uniref:hypothetical protein n=1 Tax=Myroides sp. DW712 TaxID=3389800 RepID=UPI00397C9B8C
MEQDKIEIIIDKYPDGSNIELDNLTLDATKILVRLVDAFSKIVEAENNPNIRIGLKSGSAEVSIENASTIYENLKKVSDNSPDRQNIYVSNLTIVQDIIKESNYNFKAIVYKKNNETIPIIPLFDKKFRLKRERKEIKHYYNIEFFKGKLFDSGGKKPNIHIEQNDIEHKINCSEEQASVLAKFLYKEVTISAWGKLNSNNKMVYEFCDIYNSNEFDFYSDFKEFMTTNNSLTGTEPLKHIHKKLKSYYSNGKFKESRKFLRLFCNEVADVNRLRAILLISKGVRYNEDIQDIIKTIENLIEAKTKRTIL